MISSPRVHTVSLCLIHTISLTLYAVIPASYSVQYIYTNNELYCTTRLPCPSLITVRSTDQWVDHRA